MGFVTNLPLVQQEKIEHTVKKEKTKLFNFIRKRVPKKEDAEDILQDVFIQLAEGISTIESIDKVASWLYTVARNKITDMYRKKKPENFSDKIVSSDDDEHLFFSELLADSGVSPEDKLLQSVIMEQINEALNELPEEQRQVFVMHELEDLSFKEIAEITGVTQNTLLSRKRYAVLYLRERLKDLYNEI